MYPSLLLWKFCISVGNDDVVVDDDDDYDDDNDDDNDDDDACGHIINMNG